MRIYWLRVDFGIIIHFGLVHRPSSSAPCFKTYSHHHIQTRERRWQGQVKDLLEKSRPLVPRRTYSQAAEEGQLCRVSGR